MRDWVTERRPWARRTTGSSAESWCVLTAPHSTLAGSGQSYRGCKELRKSGRCCFPLQPGLHRLSSRRLLPPARHPQKGDQALPLSSEEEEEVHVPSAQRCGWAWQLEAAHLHPASLLSHLANQLLRPLRSQGARVAAIRFLLYTSQTFSPPTPAFLIISSLGRCSVSIQGLLHRCPSSGWSLGINTADNNNADWEATQVFLPVYCNKCH